MKIYYKNHLKNFSRSLRKNSTLAEVLLWEQIKGRKIEGYQFSRQKPVGIYVVDFYCSKLKLIIEVDGITHAGRDKQDFERQQYLESIGLAVLRFYDEDIRNNMEGVLRLLYKWITENKSK